MKNNKTIKLKKNKTIKLKNNIWRSKVVPAFLYKAASTDLNIDFFTAADGVYSSYWVGKLTNTLLRRGNKKAVSRHIYRSFAILKYTSGVSPLIFLLEVLDKIKPTFRLRNYIVRRVIVKEYPIVTLRPRQFMIAVHWLKEEIQSSSGYGEQSLAEKISQKLLNFKINTKKNNLIKKRTDYTKRTIKAQFNIRYNWN